MRLPQGFVVLFLGIMPQLGISQTSNFYLPSGQANFRFNSAECPRIMESFARNEARNTSFEDVVSNELCKQVPGVLGISSTVNYKIELKEDDILASWSSSADLEWQAQGLGDFREVSKCRTISFPSAYTQISAALNANSLLTRKLDSLFVPFFVNVDMSGKFKAAVRVNEKLRTNYFGSCADPTTADAYDLTANARTSAKLQLTGNLGLGLDYLGKGVFRVNTEPSLLAKLIFSDFEFKFDQSGRDHGIFAFHQYFNTIGSATNLWFRSFGDKVGGVTRGRTNEAFVDTLFSFAEMVGGTFDRIATLIVVNDKDPTNNNSGGYQEIVDKYSDTIANSPTMKNYFDLNPYVARINDEFKAQIVAKVPRSTTFYVIPFLRTKLDPILSKNGIPPSVITNAHMEQALDFLIRRGSLDDFLRYAADVYWETDIKPRFLNMYGRQPTDNEKARILSKIASQPLLQILAEANQIIVDIATKINLPAGSVKTIPLPTRDADGDPVTYQMGLTFYNPPTYQEFLARYAHLPPCEPNDIVCEEFRLPDCGLYVDAPKCVQRYWFMPRFQTSNAIYGSVQLDTANSRLIYTPSSFPSTTYDAFTLKISEASNTVNSQSIEIVLQFTPNPTLISNLFQVHMGRPATELETSDAIDKMNAGISSYDLENYIKAQAADLVSRNTANQLAWSNLYSKASTKNTTNQNTPTLEWKNTVFVFATEGMDLQMPFKPLTADISVPSAKLTTQKIKRLDALVDAILLPPECAPDSHWRIEARVRYAAETVTTECAPQAQYRECSHGVYTPWSGNYTFANCTLASNDSDNDGIVNSVDLCPGENDNLRSADGLCPAAYLTRENNTNSTRWKNLADRALAVDLTFNGVYTADWADARSMFLNGGLIFTNKDLKMVLATTIPEAMAKRSQIEVFQARLAPFELCAFQSGGCREPQPCGSTPSGSSISRTRFLALSDPISCKSELQTSTCNNGTFGPWTGTYSYDTCKVPAPCGPTPSGTSITRVKYQSSSDPVSCKSEVQSSTCTDGTFSAWTGTYTFDTCAVPAPCGPTPSGTSITRVKYLASSDPLACKSEVQSSTCANGTFSAWTGTYTYDTCKVPASCGSTPSGSSITRTKYLTSSDPVACKSEVQTSTCSDGVLSSWTGTYTYDSCKIQTTDSDGDGVPDSSDKCPGENDAGIATKWVDADKDGYWVKKLAQCPSAPGVINPPTLKKSSGEPYTIDDNDAVKKTLYTDLAITVTDSSSYDFDLDGVLNESHNVFLIANGLQWLDLAKKCSDSTLVYTSCAAKVRLAGDLDFSLVGLNETGHLRSSAVCDMNFDGDTIDAGDKPCLEISSTKYLLGAPEHQKWFTGVIDGSGRTFRNLRVNVPGSNEIGAVSRSTWGATIRSINLEQVAVLGKLTVGAVTGWVDGGSVIDTVSSGYVKGSGTVGGLIGKINASNTSSFPLRKISGLMNASIVESTCSGLCSVGGIFAVAGGDYPAVSMSQLANHGAVIANNSTWVGGIVGMMSKQAAIVDSYNTGNITGYTVVGGIVGLEISDAKGLSRVYSSGNIKAVNSAGYIVGEHQSASAIAGYWKNTALISGGNDGVGIGSNSSTSALTDLQLKAKATFAGAGWSIGLASSTSTIWYIEEGISYPALNSLRSAYKACNMVAEMPGKCPH